LVKKQAVAPESGNADGALEWRFRSAIAVFVAAVFNSSAGTRFVLERVEAVDLTARAAAVVARIMERGWFPRAVPSGRRSAGWHARPGAIQPPPARRQWTRSRLILTLKESQ
jgi:predicted DNA-binding transcriptional regulator AlpA